MQQIDVKPSEEQVPEEGGEQLLAGKYKSEEELQKGMLELLQKQNEGKSLEEIYKGLESDLGKPSDLPEDPPQDPPAEGEAEGEARQVAENAGLNFDAISQEFQESGELSEDTYNSLERAGISKEIVDSYIAGQQAIAEKQAQAVFQTVGGEENYNSMIEWAASNLKEPEIEAFNTALSGTPEQISFAVEGLYARYSRANPSPPKGQIRGSAPSSASADVYASTAQMMQDMRDPRYQKDPSFRSAVEQKLARSNIL